MRLLMCKKGKKTSLIQYLTKYFTNKGKNKRIDNRKLREFTGSKTTHKSTSEISSDQQRNPELYLKKIL